MFRRNEKLKVKLQVLFAITYDLATNSEVSVVVRLRFWFVIFN